MFPPKLPTRWLISPAISYPDNVNDANVLPFLPAQSFKLLKTPMWSSSISTSVSGVERRRALWSYPIWRFSIMHEVLRSGSIPEIEKLVAFFNSKFGSAQAFFYYDRDDNAVTANQFGTGDGVTTKFQVTRTTQMGGISFTEPVRGFNGTPVVTVNGAATTAFSVGTLGSITFSAPPANGAILRWTGQFFFLCRFDRDELNLRQLMSGLWDNGSLDFRSVKS